MSRSAGLAFDKLSADGRQDEWDEFATAQGWSTEPPQESLEEEAFRNKVGMQYAMAILTAVIGLPMLISALRSYGRWVESTDKGITSSWGESFDFDQILQLDKKKWAKKGIAKVTYQDGDRRRRFVLDDFKFERPTMDQILYDLEQRIDPERIVNGQPEPPPGATEGHEEEMVPAQTDELA